MSDLNCDTPQFPYDSLIVSWLKYKNIRLKLWHTSTYWGKFGAVTFVERDDNYSKIAERDDNYRDDNYSKIAIEHKQAFFFYYFIIN